LRAFAVILQCEEAKETIRNRLSSLGVRVKEARKPLIHFDFKSFGLNNGAASGVIAAD